MATTVRSALSPDQMQHGVRRAIIKNIIFFLSAAALLLWCAGAVRWVWGWCYLGLVGALQAITTAVLTSRDPELLAERSEFQSGTKTWDKVLAPAVALVGPVVMLVIAGLDYRWNWSPAMPFWTHVAAIGVAAGGGVGVLWAMLSNHFFASTVRIQTDRGHRVADAGPYRYVRHPGYLGALLFTITAPFVFGSYWSLVPAVIVALLLLVRTFLEDRTLAAELPGYADYQARVPNRLIPHVW